MEEAGGEGGEKGGRGRKKGGTWKGEGKEEREGRERLLTQLCFSELPQMSTQVELTPS